MISLPYRLSGRSRLLGGEVALVFSPLVDLINGGLTARNFSRRAGIRNSQKNEPMAYCVVKATTQVGDVPGTVKLAALVPPGRDWTCIGIRLHLQGYGGTSSPFVTPYEGTFYYGGSGRSYAIAFSSEGWSGTTSLISMNGNYADPDTGHVLAEVDLTAGDRPQAFVLTAIFLAPHQR